VSSLLICCASCRIRRLRRLATIDVDKILFRGGKVQLEAQCKCHKYKRPYSTTVNGASIFASKYSAIMGQVNSMWLTGEHPDRVHDINEFEA